MYVEAYHVRVPNPVCGCRDRWPVDELPTHLVIFTNGRTIVSKWFTLFVAGIILDVCEIVGSVSPLEYGIGSSFFLLSFPQDVFPQGFGHLGRKHVASSCAR